MKGTAGFAICCVLTAGLVQPAAAQPTIRNTRPPSVTAEAEPWYLSGTPITFEGHFYYPAGPRIHFIPSEMVRSGDFRGIPLYTRTTIEPYSTVFVPVGAGIMQPYERRREGELAGTVGSSAPSFPVALSSDSSLDNVAYGPQAAAPPRLAELPVDTQVPESRPLGTSGSTEVGSIARLVPRRLPIRADSPNAIFMEYANTRWFSTGPPVPYEPSRFVRYGEKDGFPIFKAKQGSEETIYVPVVKGPTETLAPYARHKS